MMSSPGRSHQGFGAIAVWLAAALLSACASSGAGKDSGMSRGGAGGASTTSSSGGLSNSGGISGTGGGSSGVGGAGTGGVTGAGGKLGLGGASGATAGTANGGGLNVSGGSSGSGGSGKTATGGVSSSSGAPGSGGSAGGALASGGSGGASGTCPPAKALTGGKRYCSNSVGNAGGSYSYELWAEGTGSGCMTVYGKDATFSATWTNVEDLLARVGLQFDRSKTHTQLGTISAEFAETKTGNTGLVYVGVYGWTVSPLREYYILDDWGDTKPAGTASDGTPRTNVGVISVDGETYDVWKKTRVGKPAITGDNMTFDQYFSIRRTARQCGHISISEHFSGWEKLGLDLGKLVEAKLLIEAQDSTGTIDFTTATVTAK